MEWTQKGGARATGRRKGMPRWHHSSRSAFQGCMQRGLCHMGKGCLDQPRPCVVCRPGNMGRRLAPKTAASHTDGQRASWGRTDRPCLTKTYLNDASTSGLDAGDLIPSACDEGGVVGGRETRRRSRQQSEGPGLPDSLAQAQKRREPLASPDRRSSERQSPWQGWAQGTQRHARWTESPGRLRRGSTLA